jgi:protein-S-isoprenylcysteine O-methyltransferase Ste14
MTADSSDAPGATPRAPWWRGERGEWYVVVQAGIFALILLGPRSWPGAPVWSGPFASVATWAGLVLMLVGGPLSVAGVLSLGPSLTPLPYPTDAARMVERGPYAVVRHPIYSGVVFGSLGLGLFLHSWLTLVYAAAEFALFDVKSRVEERWLCERFPAYAEYKTRVKKLVPWLY